MDRAETALQDLQNEIRQHLASEPQTAESTYWLMLHGCGVFCRRHPYLTIDLEQARAAWRAISRRAFDVAKTADVLNACWQYAFARTLRDKHRQERRGDADKNARLNLQDLAAQCDGLERQLRRAYKDNSTRLLLLGIDARVSALTGMLRQVSASMISMAGTEHSQAEITLGMRTSALLEMVATVSSSGRGVPWAALAQIVNLLAQPFDGSRVSVAAKDLATEYKRISRCR